MQLFEDIKTCITSSSVLARYDPEKPTFLKTDWSAEGMEFIIMQPADDELSAKATVHLLKKVECLFNTTRSGARLQAVIFESRICTGQERLYHSFVRETAYGLWVISKNRKYLWGKHFYWLCNCKAIREVLEYDGSIVTVSKWDQKLINYHFSVIHRSARMMVDVDALSGRYGSLPTQHMQIASIISLCDKEQRPVVYTNKFSTIENTTEIPASAEAQSSAIPILIISAINDSQCSPSQSVSISLPTRD